MNRDVPEDNASVFSTARFPIVVFVTTAVACAGASVVYFSVYHDPAGGVGLLMGTIWIGCVGWLYDAWDLADRTSARSSLRPDRASADGASPGSNRSVANTLAVAGLILALLAQMVAFHYSPNFDL